MAKIVWKLVKTGCDQYVWEQVVEEEEPINVTEEYEKVPVRVPIEQD